MFSCRNHFSNTHRIDTERACFCLSRKQTRFLSSYFFMYCRISATHVELYSFLCGLKFAVHICSCLDDIGKCGSDSITCIVVECSSDVGWSLGCEINDLCVNRVIAEECNWLCICFGISCRCPGCQSAFCDDIIVKSCAACEGRFHKVNGKILFFAVGNIGVQGVQTR